MIWKILTVILAVSVAVLIAVLVKIRAQLCDINEQLDFLCEKDTNMLLLTDTNMADIGRLKERINRFLEQWHRQREAAAKKEQMYLTRTQICRTISALRLPHWTAIFSCLGMRLTRARRSII